MVLIGRVVSEEKFCKIPDDDGQRTPSDGNSSIDRLQGELKMYLITADTTFAHLSNIALGILRTHVQSANKDCSAH